MKTIGKCGNTRRDAATGGGKGAGGGVKNKCIWEKHAAEWNNSGGEEKRRKPSSLMNVWPQAEAAPK